MGLADLVSHAGLSRYAEAALVLFMAAFVAIVVWTFAPGCGREMREAGRMPLDDERTGPAGPGADA